VLDGSRWIIGGHRPNTDASALNTSSSDVTG